MDDHLHLHVGSKPAPGELSLLQGFVNTVDLESGRDDLSSPAAATLWLRHHELLGEGEDLRPGDHRRLLGFREALRELLFANNGEGAQEAGEPGESGEPLAEFLGAAPLRLEPTPAGGLRLAPTGAGAERVIAGLLAIAYRSMLEGTWSRLKACRSDTCRWAFYDASKNRSGAWCSMEVCGNRTKVRQHRERRGARSGG